MNQADVSAEIAALTDEYRLAGVELIQPTPNYPGPACPARCAVAAASLATELIEGLVAHTDRMTTNAAAAADDLLSEGRSVAALLAQEPPRTVSDDLGATDALVDDACARPPPGRSGMGRGGSR